MVNGTRRPIDGPMSRQVGQPTPKVPRPGLSTTAGNKRRTLLGRQAEITLQKRRGAALAATPHGQNIDLRHPPLFRPPLISV
jgi:hypothetical protein